MAFAERTEPEAMPVILTINGEHLRADTSGALFWERERALLLADLHLEKGSSFARSGQLLPPYDTAATLQKLAGLVARHAPKLIFFLGDTFHDPFAGERLAGEHLDCLNGLARTCSLVWIAGNHDPDLPGGLIGERVSEVASGGLVLRHHPSVKPRAGEIAGHLHPVAKVQTRSATVRRRCFINDGNRLILPAFGAYTGGVNVRDGAIAGLFDAPQVHVLGERRVLAMPSDRLLA